MYFIHCCFINMANVYTPHLIGKSLRREHYNRYNIQYATLATTVDASVEVKSIFLSLIRTSLPGSVVLNASARLETAAA
jgi:hypothetical protein